MPAFFNPRWLRHVARAIRRTRPEVVVVRDIPLAPVALWTAQRFGIPVVLDMAENYPAMLADIWTAGRQRPWDVAVRNPRAAAVVEAYCARRVEHVVVVVEENAERVAALGVPRERISVVSNTPSRARALAAGAGRDRPTGRLEVVYLGILEVPRGLIEAIDAVAMLKARGVPVRLRIVGTGRDEELFRARVRGARLSDEDVLFTGYIPRHEDALGIVGAADVGIVPSHATAQWQTSIANKLFDYMAAGLAVVTSDAAPSARVVRETRSGEVFRAGDAGDLAAALLRLVDPSARQAAGEAGRRAVLSRYNWERDGATFCRVVRDVARAARERTPHAGRA
jgi:glycosyltransferase involved in cell wall biosynthesis